MSEEQTKQNVSLEETFEQIETIIKQLESPEVTLDDSFRLYQACLLYTSDAADEL